jgi:hypothetical protein
VILEPSYFELELVCSKRVFSPNNIEVRTGRSSLQQEATVRNGDDKLVPVEDLLLDHQQRDSRGLAVPRNHSEVCVAED